MKRLSLVLAIAALLIGIPVQAQKKTPIIGPPPPGIRPASVLIQGENGEGYMKFDLRSGAFYYNLCEYGYERKGTGEVKIDGCNVYFSTVTDDYSVFATVNMCEHQAKCVVEVFHDPSTIWDTQPITEYLIDTNMLDSAANCVPATKK